jgi:predicted O-linked N-acetylglucosamine transferase (SPINDLY family)
LNESLDLQTLFAQALELQQRGDLDGAISSYLQILTRAPSSVAALNNVAGIFYATGRFGEALAHYDRAMAAMPENPDLIVNRVFALRELGRLEEAIGTCEWIAAHWPEHIGAWTVLGGLFQQLRRFPEALECYNRAIALHGSNLEALNNSSVVYCALGDYRRALESLDMALAIAPNSWQAHNNLGNALRGLLRFEEALESYRKAQALNPEYAQAFYNQGEVCCNLLRYEDAVAAYDRAAALDPDMPDVQGAQLFARMQLCDWDGFERRCEALLAAVDRGVPAASPFTLLLLPSSPAQQRKAAQVYMDRHFHLNRHFAKAPAAAPALHHNSRIRIAYVAATFRDHPVMQLACDVFRLHDRRKFEIYGYSLGPGDGSALRTQLEKACDHFIDAQDMDDVCVAKLMGEHEIDIAVDLDGFTQGSRTGILAQRPAPIQVSWWGYPGTMAAAHIDYIIADETLVPKGTEAGFSERVLRLPFSYQPNSERPIVDPPVSRASVGLPENGMVFCCFNNPCKITPDVFAVWMRLLTAVPGSVLWLLGASATAQRNLVWTAGQHGVAGTRIIFAPRVDRRTYLSRMMAADLFLDTFHYNAHTTASDALWVGLPLVTKAGQTFASRVAASLLHAVGLAELITNSSQDYERLIIKLAREPEMLAGLRRRLMENGPASPLFDIAQFTRDLETALMGTISPERRRFLPS